MEKTKKLLNLETEDARAIDYCVSSIKDAIEARISMREFNKSVIESLLDADVIDFIKNNLNTDFDWPVFEGLQDSNGDMLYDGDYIPDDAVVIEPYWVINFNTFDVKREVDKSYFEYCKLDQNSIKHLLSFIESFILADYE